MIVFRIWAADVTEALFLFSAESSLEKRFREDSSSGWNSMRAIREP